MRGDARELDGVDAGELRDRAARGVALLGARGVAIYALGTVANLALAALLVPRDFGIVALGTVVLTIGTYVAQGGFSAALIRREEPPGRRELEVVLGAQLAIAAALAAAVLVAATLAGDEGLVVATMAGAVPIVVLRTPALVVLERRLEYRSIATAEVLEAAVYYAWSVGTVVLGAGVWGLATAVVVRAAVGTGWLLATRPTERVRPRWSLRQVRPVLGPGMRFQAATVSGIAREQLVNVGVGAVGGLTTLGIWNLAWRVLQVPMLLFATFGRVAFPALARLLEAGENPRSVIERMVAALAVVIGVVVVGMVALAPALPAVVGDEWEDVPAVLLWSGLALTVHAPLTAAAGGYLLAVGRPDVVTAATLAGAAAWLGVALPLLDAIGPAATGVGWIAGGLVSVAVLWRATAAATGASVTPARLAPTLLSVVAAALAWSVATGIDSPLLAAASAAVGGELLLAAGLLVFARAAIADLRTLARRGLSLR